MFGWFGWVRRCLNKKATQCLPMWNLLSFYQCEIVKGKQYLSGKSRGFECVLRFLGEDCVARLLLTSGVSIDIGVGNDVSWLFACSASKLYLFVILATIGGLNGLNEKFDDHFLHWI